MDTKHVFVTGGTGYIGRRLIPELLRRGHEVRALVRPGSERMLPRGCSPVLGDARNRMTFVHHVSPGDTFVQLAAPPRAGPAPAKGGCAADLVPVREAVAAATVAGARHFVYLSVARPAPVLHAYQETRARGEELVRRTGLDATLVRPWYVVGPGHRWPVCLLPAFWLLEKLPPTCETARRLGLVTLGEMVGALVRAVEEPPHGVRVFTVEDIRRAAAEA